MTVGGKWELDTRAAGDKKRGRTTINARRNLEARNGWIRVVCVVYTQNLFKRVQYTARGSIGRLTVNKGPLVGASNEIESLSSRCPMKWSVYFQSGRVSYRHPSRAHYYFVLLIH